MDRYTPKELRRILLRFNRGDPLPELSEFTGRSAYGLALKMRALSEQDPDTWDPQKVNELTRREIKRHKGDLKRQKLRWHERQKGRPVEHREPTYRRLRSEVNMERFAAFLKDLVTSRYPTKKHFAVEMGLHPSLLSHYLSGKRKPSSHFLKSLSEKFHLSYEALVALTEKAPGPNQPGLHANKLEVR